MAVNPSTWTTCPICKTRLKAEKLSGHMNSVHPKGVATKEDRAKVVGRRKAASSALTIALVAIVVVLIISGIYYAVANMDYRGSNTGDKPYNFTHEDTDGTEWTLDDHMGDRPVLMGFMSTTCAHCAKMSEVFQDLYVNYSDKVEFVIVISNSDATKSSIKTWANQHGIEFSVLYDKGGKTFDTYNLAFYPSIYIVNKGSKIDWTNKGTDNGEFTYSELAAKLDKVS